MHGMHCLPLQFLNIFVHSVSSASLWAVFTPQIMDEDHVLYLQPPTSCQTWIKNGDKLGLHCLNERNTASDLFLVQTWTTFKMLVLVSFHTLNKNKIPSVGRWKDFFFYAAFLKIQSFYVNGLFSEAQFYFFVLFLVSLIHSLCFVDLSINCFLSFFFGSSYGYTASPRGSCSWFKILYKKVNSCYSQLMHF